MKKYQVILAVAVAGWLVSSVSHAEVYKCIINGAKYYQNMPCPNRSAQTGDRATAFDGWAYGTHISGMKREARRRQLAMAPGQSSITSSYNEKLLNRRPEAREYTYKTNLMGQLTTVTLYFTKTSQLLYKIRSTFHVSSLSQDERKYFYESLYARLSKKYGKPEEIQTDAAKKSAKNNPLGTLITGNLIDVFQGTLQAWGMGTNNLVTLTYKKKYQHMTSYRLIYQSVSFNARNSKEVAAEIRSRTNRAVSKDAGRL